MKLPVQANFRTVYRVNCCRETHQNLIQKSEGTAHANHNLLFDVSRIIIDMGGGSERSHSNVKRHEIGVEHKMKREQRPKPVQVKWLGCASRNEQINWKAQILPVSPSVSHFILTTTQNYIVKHFNRLFCKMMNLIQGITSMRMREVSQMRDSV